MNSETILKSDLLDILFDKRNKTYGAYILRKFYPNRIKTSLLMMLAIAVLFSAFTFLPDEKITPATYKIAGSVTLGEQPSKKKEEVIKRKTESASKKPQAKFTSDMVIVQEKDSADIFQNIRNLAIGNENITAPEGPGTGKPGLGGEGPGVAPPQNPAAPAAINDGPEMHPDIQASFPGGDKELIKFLQRNLRSPRDMEEGETVEVKIKYVVGFDGNLQSFNVLKDGGEIFNGEVIRVLKKMPKWNPGKKGGQNVPVYYTIPVKFTATE